MADEAGTRRGARARRPRWVYDDGIEPDYRFSFANERTFLAWIRTSLALLAAGVALDVVDLAMPDGAQRLLAVLLVGLSLVSATAAWWRWATAERAIRRNQSLPSFGIGALVTLVLVLAAVVVLLVGM